MARQEATGLFLENAQGGASPYGSIGRTPKHAFIMEMLMLVIEKVTKFIGSF